MAEKHSHYILKISQWKSRGTPICRSISTLNCVCWPLQRTHTNESHTHTHAHTESLENVSEQFDQSCNWSDFISSFWHVRKIITFQWTTNRGGLDKIASGRRKVFFSLSDVFFFFPYNPCKFVSPSYTESVRNVAQPSTMAVCYPWPLLSKDE